MIDLFERHIIPAAYAVLPPEMNSPQATAMLLSIGYQESRFAHRKQIGGPAMGAYQFELGGGVIGVLGHHKTSRVVLDAMSALNYRYSPTPQGCYQAIEHNDILATIFARLLLWTLPDPLPTQDRPDAGWRQYISAWRPGKPHIETWPDAWAAGWGTDA